MCIKCDIKKHFIGDAEKVLLLERVLKKNGTNLRPIGESPKAYFTRQVDDEIVSVALETNETLTKMAKVNTRDLLATFLEGGDFKVSKQALNIYAAQLLVSGIEADLEDEATDRAAAEHANT